MKFSIVMSRSAFFNQKNEIRSETLDLIESVKGTNIIIGIITRDPTLYKRVIEQELGKNHGIKFSYRNRWYKDQNLNRKNFVIIGAVKQDMYIAANNKALLINPLWISDVESEITEYGFALESTKQLIECIKILTIENEIFATKQITPITKIITLSNANKYYKKSEKNSEMIYKYRGILKYNKDSHLYALYFHYLTLMMGDNKFKYVDYWMTFPSSSGRNENAIYDIAKNTRYLFKNARKKEILIRNTPTRKSTSIDREERIKQGAARHFETINLNPEYMGKLVGKRIVILDDFVTNGSSFEAARNLLETQGVEEIILISIGTFKQDYQFEQYIFKGDLFKSGYKYERKSKKALSFDYNDNALKVTENIYDILTNN